MKIRPEDLEALRARIAPLDTPELRRTYALGDFARADRAKDLSKRYRWDLLWASKIKIGDGVGIKGDLDLYAYMDDTHIDTALRAIVPDIVDRFADVKKPVAPKTDTPIHDPWGLSRLD